ncbi:hypothetical protein QBA54_33730 [Streptomyces sp. B21-108]
MRGRRRRRGHHRRPLHRPRGLRLPDPGQATCRDPRRDPRRAGRRTGLVAHPRRPPAQRRGRRTRPRRGVRVQRGPSASGRLRHRPAGRAARLCTGPHRGRLPLSDPGCDELITFALPRDWIDLPVDRWASTPDDDTPLGCVYPLVVTDQARRRPGVRHQLTRVWNRLDTVPGARVHRIECGSTEEPRRLRLRLRQDDACLAGFSTAPAAPRTRPHFESSLNAPAPIVVWSREGCATGPDEPCAGGDGCAGKVFLDELDTCLSGVPPAELPRRVLALREEADAEDGHWAHDIQLLWDDPRVFTDPHGEAPAHAHSPVA